MLCFSRFYSELLLQCLQIQLSQLLRLNRVDFFFKLYRSPTCCLYYTNMPAHIHASTHASLL